MQVIVAERIKELMKEENLNQVRLAEKIGVKQNTISAWLSGKKEPYVAVETCGFFRRFRRLHYRKKEFLRRFNI